MRFLIELKEGLAIAWDAILANKMRSTLATLGIIIGIVTVTSMATAIDALNRALKDSLSILGADVLFVSKYQWVDNSEDSWRQDSKRRDITVTEEREVARLMPAKAISPVAGTEETVKFERRSASRVQVIGANEQFLEVSGFLMREGRFLTRADAEGARPVCVIGNDIWTNLFHEEPPLGQYLTVGTRKLQVVGVLEKRGSFLGVSSFDNQVIIPIGQFITTYMRDPNVDIDVKVNDVRQLADWKEELHGVLRKARHLAPGAPDNFDINQQEQFIKFFNKQTSIIASVGLLITGMSLFVGGIGIMNIMYVSVAERTREIGIRKAIGARKSAILTQFLIEAACICVMGGLLALGITFGLTILVGHFWPYFPIQLSLPVIGMAVAVSAATGLTSGFLPAWRAARLDPVEALRNE